MIPALPSVYLVSTPQVDYEEMTAYLEEVDGAEWLEGLDNDETFEDLVEFAGRLCYRSWKPGLNPNVNRVRTDSGEYLANILSSGHGSVLEHANVSIMFHDVSRVFTHELVRHRAGCAYSQESLRYVRLDELRFWFPEWAKRDRELMDRSLALLHQMEQHQTWMAEHFGLDEVGTPFAEKKHKTSFMRRFAPEGVATGILWTANIRSLRHVIELRTAPGAEEEIAAVFDLVACRIQDKAPHLLQDFDRSPDGVWRPTNRKV